jgi:hypothetical protein
MCKATILVTFMMFAGVPFAAAMPMPFGGAGQSLFQSTDEIMTLVATDKKTKKAKKSSKPTDGTSPQTMPPGHRM